MTTVTTRAGRADGGVADIDRVYIKDPAGLLTPERARTLIPAVSAGSRAAWNCTRTARSGSPH